MLPPSGLKIDVGKTARMKCVLVKEKTKEILQKNTIKPTTSITWFKDGEQISESNLDKTVCILCFITQPRTKPTEAEATETKKYLSAVAGLEA